MKEKEIPIRDPYNERDDVDVGVYVKQILVEYLNDIYSNSFTERDISEAILFKYMYDPTTSSELDQNEGSLGLTKLLYEYL